MIKMQYLGTGAAEGFPGLFCECAACRAARRLGGKNIKMRSTTLLNDHILIDISPDIYAQSLRWNVRLSQVDHVVVTHSHEDHLDTYSVCTRLKHGATILPGVSREEDCLHFYGNKESETAITKAVSQSLHMDQSRYSYQVIRPGARIRVGELEFIPLPANHKKDEECYIYAVTDGEKWLFYANDTGRLPPKTLEMIREMKVKFDVVSMDCARGILPGDGHMGIGENRQLKEQLMQMGAAAEDTGFYLNHLSHMSGVIHDDLQTLADADGMKVAYDGMEITV